jgi:hypothetical protein
MAGKSNGLLNVKKALAIKPVDWLSSPPKSPNAKWVPGQILACYTGTPTVCKYTGPYVFFRAAGLKASGQSADAYSGEWWVESEVLSKIYSSLAQYKGWLTSDELTKATSAQYRAVTALCRDWNDMSEIYCLTLPTNETLEGLSGPAKAQPEWSNRGLNPADPRTPMLRGQGEQVFFKVKNPFWVRPCKI